MRVQSLKLTCDQERANAAAANNHSGGAPSTLVRHDIAASTDVIITIDSRKSVNSASNSIDLNSILATSSQPSAPPPPSSSLVATNEPRSRERPPTRGSVATTTTTDEASSATVATLTDTITALTKTIESMQKQLDYVTKISAPTRGRVLHSAAFKTQTTKKRKKKGGDKEN
jgi:hypothetical protein